mgnify:CR=1 FL=1
MGKPVKFPAANIIFTTLTNVIYNINLTDMGDLALSADGFVQISNTCTVFAEHEVTSRLAEGAGVAEIVAGLHEAIASRVVNMTRHLGIEKDVVVTGGGAKNKFLVDLIKQKSTKLVVIPDTQSIDFKEALIFAFLGVLYIEQQHGALASVTGAKTSSICGCLYL